MPTTPKYALPYPLENVTADIPVDMQALCTRLETVFDLQGGIPLGATSDWPWGAAQIPTWALLAFGQLLTAASYAALQVIADAAGRPYGGSAGVNFNLPDYRGRVGAGKDDMGGTAANRITAAISGVAGTVLGAVLGAEGITLTTAQLPAHNHTGTTDGWSADHSHAFSANTGTVSADHTHWEFSSLGGGGNVGVQGSNASALYGSQQGDAGPPTGGISANHYHGVSGQTGGASVNHTHTFTSANAGSGSAHQNTQPTIIVNKILRVL